MPRTTDDVLPAGRLSSTEQPTLTGGPVRLRPWRTDDHDAVVAAFTDPDIEHWHLRRLEVGFHRLWMMHSTSNPPSCAVARGAGFETEGTMREALRHVDGWHDMHVHGRVMDQVQG